eukprot:403345511
MNLNSQPFVPEDQLNKIHRSQSQTRYLPMYKPETQLSTPSPNFPQQTGGMNKSQQEQSLITPEVTNQLIPQPESLNKSSSETNFSDKYFWQLIDIRKKLNELCLMSLDDQEKERNKKLTENQPINPAPQTSVEKATTQAVQVPSISQNQVPDYSNIEQPSLIKQNSEPINNQNQFKTYGQSLSQTRYSEFQNQNLITLNTQKVTFGTKPNVFTNKHSNFFSFSNNQQQQNAKPENAFINNYNDKWNNVLFQPNKEKLNQDNPSNKPFYNSRPFDQRATPPQFNLDNQNMRNQLQMSYQNQNREQQFVQDEINLKNDQNFILNNYQKNTQEEQKIECNPELLKLLQNLKYFDQYKQRVDQLCDYIGKYNINQKPEAYETQNTFLTNFDTFLNFEDLKSKDQEQHDGSTGGDRGNVVKNSEEQTSTANSSMTNMNQFSPNIQPVENQNFENFQKNKNFVPSHNYRNDKNRNLVKYPPAQKSSNQMRSKPNQRQLERYKIESIQDKNLQEQIEDQKCQYKSQNQRYNYMSSCCNQGACCYQQNTNNCVKYLNENNYVPNQIIHSKDINLESSSKWKPPRSIQKQPEFVSMYQNSDLESEQTPNLIPQCTSIDYQQSNTTVEENQKAQALKPYLNPALKLIKHGIFNQASENSFENSIPLFCKHIVIRTCNDENIYNSLISGTWIPRPMHVLIFKSVIKDAINLQLSNNLKTDVPIYLFFVTKAKGLFRGMGQMMSGLKIDVDGNEYFNIKWIFFKDIDIKEFECMKYDEETNDYVGSNVITLSHKVGRIFVKKFIEFKSKNSILTNERLKQYIDKNIQ